MSSKMFRVIVAASVTGFFFADDLWYLAGCAMVVACYHLLIEWVNEEK